MGYQLWTSPITGYRRRGTRLTELRSLLSSGITAHAILEPLQSCPIDAPAGEMARAMELKDFDVAGVRERTNGRILGFVERRRLTQGTVGDHLRPLNAEQLTSDSTPLPGVLTILKSRPMSFVLVGPEVRGIVTRADLNKPPVRVYLFGLISLLEMHLGFWAKRGYPEDSWQKKIKAGRLRAAKELQAKRRNPGEVALFDCLQLCDKGSLVVARDDLRARMSLGTKTKARGLLGSAESLRNDLAHSQQDLAKGASWERTIVMVESIEAVVHASDGEVEKEARRSSKQGADPLLASA